VRLDPQNSRNKTTLAVALDSAGRTEEELDKLDGWAAGADADILGLALQYSLKLRRVPEALKYAEYLALDCFCFLLERRDIGGVAGRRRANA
ncbi:hypothetical protein ACCS97_37660, partial [Rhizobium ruizarguesonis]